MSTRLEMELQDLEIDYASSIWNGTVSCASTSTRAFQAGIFILSRLSILRSMFENRGLGLEIGPLDKPVASKKDGFNVDVLDHASTETLIQKYSNQPWVDVNKIENVDYVSDGRSILDTIGQKCRYDWIIASHVIEHTTDFIGFINDCSELLKPSGRLVLAVPDKRRCFDVLRRPSSTGDVLQAHFEKRTRHSPGQIFDHFANNVTKHGSGAWQSDATGETVLQHTLAETWRYCQMAAEMSDYFDCHAWVFSPSSFRLIIHDLERTELIRLREDRVIPTDNFEFFVSLSAQGAGVDIDRVTLAQLALSEMTEGGK